MLLTPENFEGIEARELLNFIHSLARFRWDDVTPDAELVEMTNGWTIRLHNQWTLDEYQTIEPELPPGPISAEDFLKLSDKEREAREQNPYQVVLNDNRFGFTVANKVKVFIVWGREKNIILYQIMENRDVERTYPKTMWRSISQPKVVIRD